MAAPTTSARASGHSLLHPVPLVALALLIVNDHVLKRACPGWITGKLSDVAGMVFFPLFLVGMLEAWARVRRSAPPGRRAVLLCADATAIVFAAVKTWEPATQAFGGALGALQWPFHAAGAVITGAAVPAFEPASVVCDPTDLLAVPFVLVAVVVGFRRAA